MLNKTAQRRRQQELEHLHQFFVSFIFDLSALSNINLVL